MKKLSKRISKRLRLGIDLAAVLLLLFLIWAFLGYPSLTANQAFRRGLKNAAYPDAELDVLLWGIYGIGGNDTFAYRVWLSKDIGWKPEKVESCTSKVAQDVWCVPIPWPLQYSYRGGDHGYYYIEPEGLYNASTGEAVDIPCFAVKAPGSTAGLTLVLEDGDYYKDQHSSRTEWPLLLLEIRNGWFVFGFNTKEIYEAPYENFDYYRGYGEPYHSYFTWIDQYYSENNSCFCKPETCPPAHLELTTYDETGTVLRTESWPLVGE